MRGPVVLLVDNSAGDIRLTKEAFREINPSVQLHVVGNGVEAMSFLTRDVVHADAPRPDLILLDLNMPLMGGHEVLARIKADPSLRAIPTVVLSTSREPGDIASSYRLQANCYLAKPEEFDAFAALLRSVNDFWLMKASLGHGPGAPERRPTREEGIR